MAVGLFKGGFTSLNTHFAVENPQLLENTTKSNAAGMSLNCRQM